MPPGRKPGGIFRLHGMPRCMQRTDHARRKRLVIAVFIRDLQPRACRNGRKTCMPDDIIKARDGLRPRARRPRAQPEERVARHPARRAGGVHRRVRLGQVVAGVRHAVRRGAAALPRIGLAVRPAAVPPDGGAGGRRHRRPAAGRGAAAAARHAHHALLGRQRHHAVEPAAHAVLARRRLSAPGSRMLYAESFSPNTPEGACPRCHGLGRVYEVTERRWCRTTR